VSAYRTVVVGTDGSQSSLRAVNRAGALAGACGARLVVVCAYLPSRADDRGARRGAEPGDDARQVVGSAPAEDTVRVAAEEAVADAASVYGLIHPDDAPLVAAAEAEAESIREQARQQGLDEGFAAGREAARLDLEPTGHAMAAAVEQLRQLEAEAADRVEPHAVELAMRVAEKVVAGAIEVEPERVLDVVRGALRAIVERERIVIQVNPEDLAILREGLDELAGSLGGIEHVEVQEERRVKRGGAVVRTTVGEIDAKISTKLERAHAAIVEELGA
jgi:flagellar biosynthesis/type III secretory pathway protein FliH